LHIYINNSMKRIFVTHKMSAI